MKKFKGKALSTKMDKTVVVEVEHYRVHPIYGKRVKIKKKYYVHDEMGVKEGERVIFGETKPISKTKYWKIIERSKDDSVKK